MSPFFSIIVPVYNVEEYLSDCIESVTSQCFNDYEIILIDDGSTDNSSYICKMYAREFDEITYIKKENGGLSEARNYGIEKSSGKYLIFLDSDDYIEKNSLFYIHKILVEDSPDVLIGLLKKYYDDNNVIADKIICTRHKIKSFDKYQAINNLFPYIEWSAPKFIVKREIVSKELRFKVGYLHEDVDWTTNLFLVCNKYSLYEEPFYYHRMKRPGSIMNTMNSKRVNDVFSIVSESLIKIEQLQLPRKVFLSLASRLSQSTFFYFSSINLFHSEEKSELIKKITDNDFILKYSKKLNHRITYFIMKVFGTRITLVISDFVRKQLRMQSDRG